MLACGASSEGEAEPDAAGEIVGYQELALQTQSATDRYRATMTNPNATLEACAGLYEQYDGQVRPLLSQMVQLSGNMDGFMNGRRAGRFADSRCVAATMMDELDYHRSVACGFPRLAQAQAEVTRHAEVMATYAQHLEYQCDQMLLSLGEGPPAWAPVLQGCEAWDGYCSAMMHSACCAGGMMHQGCRRW